MKAVQFTFLLLVFYCFESSKYHNFIFLVVLVLFRFLFGFKFLTCCFCFLRFVCRITLMKHFHSKRCGCYRTGVSSEVLRWNFVSLKGSLKNFKKERTSP